MTPYKGNKARDHSCMNAKHITSACMQADTKMLHALQARSVPEDCESAEALMMVAEDITAQSFVVMSVDLITDVRLEVTPQPTSVCYTLHQEESRVLQQIGVPAVMSLMLIFAVRQRIL